MARQPVSDLVVRRGGAVVEASAARSALDLRVLAARSPVSPGAMVVAGVGIVGVGLLVQTLLPLTFVINAIAKVLFSVGAGTAALGVLKKVAPPKRPALPPVDPALLAERRRRLRVLVGDAGRGATFEFLVERSRWTAQAVLSTLLDMKERGEVIEDLDLDTGEWVYRPAHDGLEAPGRALMLEERRSELAGEDRA